jgi:hypothetical protein
MCCRALTACSGRPLQSRAIAFADRLQIRGSAVVSAQASIGPGEAAKQLRKSRVGLPAGVEAGGVGGWEERERSEERGEGVPVGAGWSASMRNAAMSWRRWLECLAVAAMMSLESALGRKTSNC